jgi:hypothetical protein
VTANDDDDPDTGPNGLQNFPVLTSSASAGGSTTITGTLNSTPSTANFRIEFFANTVCNGDTNGVALTDDYGEGEVFLGSTTVSTDANGDASFSVSLPVAVTDSAAISATATSPDSSTSEFSQCILNTTPEGCYVVINKNDAGFGSLRQAIMDANAHVSTIADTIKFNIDAGTPHTIRPVSALPDITDPVIIDGTSNPDASCGSWPPTLTVELDGSNAGGAVSGLTLTNGAGGSTICGLVINRFGRGIYLNSSGNNRIECNFIGTDTDGDEARPNDIPIDIQSAASNVVGGTTVSKRNLISGNGWAVLIKSSDSTLVQGNYIGTNAAGTSALGNGVGIQVYESDENIIGGTAAPSSGTTTITGSLNSTANSQFRIEFFSNTVCNGDTAPIQ